MEEQKENKRYLRHYGITLNPKWTEVFEDGDIVELVRDGKVINIVQIKTRNIAETYGK